MICLLPTLTASLCFTGTLPHNQRPLTLNHLKSNYYQTSTVLRPVQSLLSFLLDPPLVSPSHRVGAGEPFIQVHSNNRNSGTNGWVRFKRLTNNKLRSSGAQWEESNMYKFGTVNYRLKTSTSSSGSSSTTTTMLTTCNTVRNLVFPRNQGT